MAIGLCSVPEQTAAWPLAQPGGLADVFLISHEQQSPIPTLTLDLNRAATGR